MVDEVLEGVELSAGGDIEAAAVQLSDAVVLHVRSLHVVLVQYRQRERPCNGKFNKKAVNSICPFSLSLLPPNDDNNVARGRGFLSFRSQRIRRRPLLCD